MIISIVKFIHLLFAVSFLGLQIASYYYITTSRNSGSVPLLQYTLKLTLMIDVLLLAVIASIYGTCAYLVSTNPEVFSGTPWVVAACVLLTVVTVCFCTNMLIKYKNFKSINQNLFKYGALMHVNYIAIILLLILIIRDAVTRSTFFPGLL